MGDYYITMWAPSQYMMPNTFGDEVENVVKLLQDTHRTPPYEYIIRQKKKNNNGKEDLLYI